MVKGDGSELKLLKGPDGEHLEYGRTKAIKLCCLDPLEQFHG
jgi:hypothetical protein